MAGASAQRAEALEGDNQLVVEGVSKKFGGVTAVQDVSLDVPRGAILSIIGPNGAGKTSLLNMISGFYKPDTGRIELAGLDITQKKPSQIAALGVGSHFKIFSDRIAAPGDGLIIFQGMRDHTAESIKSLEGFKRAWIEEAQNLSARSLALLRPTIRARGSELWASWNPTRKSDAIYDFLRAKKPKNRHRGAGELA